MRVLKDFDTVVRRGGKTARLYAFADSQSEFQSPCHTAYAHVLISDCAATTLQSTHKVALAGLVGQSPLRLG